MRNNTPSFFHAFQCCLIIRLCISAIIEAYEKALAELVAEKEKLTDNYEVVNEKLRQERDIHHQHLMSLENTFSDLHK